MALGMEQPVLGGVLCLFQYLVPAVRESGGREVGPEKEVILCNRDEVHDWLLTYSTSVRYET